LANETAPPELGGEQSAETKASLADAFAADHNPAGGRHQFDATQAEIVIQPDSVLDPLGRKPEATVGVFDVAMADIAPGSPMAGSANKSSCCHSGPVMLLAGTGGGTFVH